MTAPTYKFRPHHFMCSNGFQGVGYSSEFVENYWEIVRDLRGSEGDKVELKVTEFTDDICGPCPHRRGKLCNTQSTIQALDTAHAKALNLKPGFTLTWGEAKRRIVEKVTNEVFDDICKLCPFKELGLCQQALDDLRQQAAADPK